MKQHEFDRNEVRRAIECGEIMKCKEGLSVSKIMRRRRCTSQHYWGPKVNVIGTQKFSSTPRKVPSEDRSNLDVRINSYDYSLNQGIRRVPSEVWHGCD